MMEENEPDFVEEIRARISQRYIHITRVPKKTYDIFKDWANEEFCNDYGMALKHLMDFYFGLIPSGVEHLEQAIEALRQDVEVLKLAVAKPKEEVKVRKRLDGS